MTGAPILVVDDDDASRSYLALALREEGYEVRSATNGLEALLALENELPRLVLTDLRMPEIDGLELLTRIGQRWPGLPVILLTVEEDVATVVKAVRLGAVNYLVKPVSPAALRTAVTKALAAGGERPAAPAAAGEIVGRSRGIVDVRHLVSVAAPSDVNVLVTGEAGTEKELVARAIHRGSRQAGGPFVAHDCAETPPDRFESEFFGHLRGAFDGVDEDQLGLLQRADGGILFLDQIESLGDQHQAELLRVIDDSELRPLGSVEAHPVSVRFIAASSRAPQELLRDGLLRKDLYYRLQGFELHLPALRERRDDIPLLAAHFLEGKGWFTAEAVSALRDAPWEGNVQELRSCVLAAQSSAGEGEIGLRQLLLGSVTDVTAKRTDEPVEVETLRDAEHAAIVRALNASKGNQSEAARTLGIDRATLRRKIAQLGIGEGD